MPSWFGEVDTTIRVGALITLTMASVQEMLKQQRYSCAEFGSETLLVLPDGRTVDLATGYIPLLSTFTTEDRAAKGLRKGGETHSKPVYFSLLELLRDNRSLLISGPTGNGKSTFAKHLCYTLAIWDQTAYQHLSSEETKPEERQGNLYGMHPCYFAVRNAQDLAILACKTIPTLLASLLGSADNGLVVVIDIAESADEGINEHIESINSQLQVCTNKAHRLLLLANPGVSSSLTIPSSIAKHTIKSLTSFQRRKRISQLTRADQNTIDFALGDAASNPALFALALRSRHQGDEEEALLDSWLATVAGTGVPGSYTTVVQ